MIKPAALVVYNILKNKGKSLDIQIKQCYHFGPLAIFDQE